MDDKLSQDLLFKIVGRLYLESQVEMSRLSTEVLKLRQERDQALELVKRSNVTS